MSVEIYICKQGQSLNEGRMEMSHDIHGREDAQADAKQKTKFDKTIDRIAYYKMNDNGDFKNFYTFRNPLTHKASDRPAGGGGAGGIRPKRKMKPKKKTGWEKVKSSIGLK